MLSLSVLLKAHGSKRTVTCLTGSRLLHNVIVKGSDLHLHDLHDLIFLVLSFFTFVFLSYRHSLPHFDFLFTT